MLQGRLGSHSMSLIQDDNVAWVSEYEGELICICPVPQYLKDWVRWLINYCWRRQVPQVKYTHLSVFSSCGKGIDVTCERDRVHLAVVRNQLLHDGLSVQIPYRADPIQLCGRYHGGLLLVPVEASHWRNMFGVYLLLYLPEQFPLAFWCQPDVHDVTWRGKKVFPCRGFWGPHNLCGRVLMGEVEELD